MSRDGSPLAFAAPAGLALLALLVAAPAGAESVQDANVSLDAPLAGAGAVEADGDVYLFGGATPNGTDLHTDAVRRLDPDAGELEVLDVRLPSPRTEVAAVWTGEQAYLFGGTGCQTSDPQAPMACREILRFDPAERELEDIGARLPVPGPPVEAVWSGEHAYLFPDESTSILRWTPGEDEVTEMDRSLGDERPGASAVWIDRYALVFGGGTDAIHRYDPAAKELDRVDATLPSPRNDTAALALDGKAYVIGGRNSTTENPLDDVLVYRPLSDGLTARPVALPDGRADVAAAALDGQALLPGGRTGGGPTDRVTRYVPHNSPPQPRLTLTREQRTVTVDASESRDPDGDLETYRVRWGDGNASTGGPTHEHTYEYAGTYELEFVVEDGRGANATLTRTLDFQNQAPTADFDVRIERGTVTANASPARDPDGEIRTYEWSWGDGATAAGGPEQRHAYREPGPHEIRLTVADQDGATDTLTRTVRTESYPPEPVLEVRVDGWTVHANASASRDPGGRLEAHELRWGDGNATGDLVANHTYTETGERTIQLVVTDDDGNTERLNRTVAVENQPPEPRFNVTVDGVEVRVDAANTTDLNGRVAAYEWSWGDGTHAAGPRAEHAYQRPGSYEIQLTARDAEGLEATANRTVEIQPQPPQARINLSVVGLRVQADATASVDPDGALETYRWSFDDGDTARGPRADHHYAGPGTYEIRLTVVDEDGHEATANRTLTLEDGPSPPQPAAEITTTGLQVRADGADTEDPDDDVASYTWSWGDGSTAAGPNATHTYEEPGSYKVRLEVRDAENETGWIERVVTVPDDETPPPTREIRAQRSGLRVEVRLADADAASEDYRWAFGDGGTARGPTATHTYPEGGTYQLRLTVEAADGSARNLTRSIDVAAPDGPPEPGPPTGADGPGASAVAGDLDLDAAGDGAKEAPLGPGVLAVALGAALAAARSRP